MLTSLSIRDIVLIDRLDLHFGHGLWTLTGETGAGKSILLDALGLAIGNRADRKLVRQGAAQGSVTAVFEPDTVHAVWHLLEDQGLTDGTDVILRRVQLADGRSRAFVNDQPVSISTLRSVGRSLVEIHGQHDDRALLEPVMQRELLDKSGGLEKQLGQVRRVYSELGEVQAALQVHESALDRPEMDESYLRFAIDELEQLAPRDGEEAALGEERAVLMNSESIAEELQAAGEALRDDGGLSARLNAALKTLERANAKVSGALDGVIASIDRALIELDEATASVADTQARFNFDPVRLAEVDNRLFALRDAARKHRVTVSNLQAKRDALAAQLGAIADRDAETARLQAAVEKARVAYQSKAADLSARRVRAAKALDKAAAKEFAPLKLEKARFRTAVNQVAEDRGNADGIDRITFEVSTNPGAPFGSLTEIASGGEFSRFSLALKVALGGKNEASTIMIFDEVDRGVGGAVADAVGERLARLALDGQVLVVTHAPQVAARADHHLKITKEARGKGATVTQVVPLSTEDRLDEIARMLSGSVVTDEARAAAARLLTPDSSTRTGTAG